MNYSDGPIPRCGCEYGDDCTKTTVCAANAHAEELEAENTRLREALEHIARHFGSAEQCRELAQSALEGE